MEATVRNASNIWRGSENMEMVMTMRNVMEKMSVEQLSELLSFYHMMGQICSDVLERELAASLDT